MNRFEDKLYQEFEQNLQRILGLSMDDFLVVIRQSLKDLHVKFDEILNNDGPKALRSEMNWQIIALSVIYKERDVGRTLTKEEFYEHAQSLGLDRPSLKDKGASKEG